VLLSWIFLQTLLVIPRGTRTNEVAACIVFVSVSKNMRVQLKRDNNDRHFSEFFLRIEDGKHKEPEGKITLPIGLGIVVRN